MVCIYIIIWLPQVKSSYGKVMFLHLSVILFMREGCLPTPPRQTTSSRQAPPGRYPTPGRQILLGRHPLSRHPPGQTHPLWADTSPWVDTPPGQTLHLGRTPTTPPPLSPRDDHCSGWYGTVLECILVLSEFNTNKN